MEMNEQVPVPGVDQERPLCLDSKLLEGVALYVDCVDKVGREHVDGILVDLSFVWWPILAGRNEDQKAPFSSRLPRDAAELRVALDEIDSRYEPDAANKISQLLALHGVNASKADSGEYEFTLDFDTYRENQPVTDKIVGIAKSLDSYYTHFAAMNAPLVACGLSAVDPNLNSEVVDKLVEDYGITHEGILECLAHARPQLKAPESKALSSREYLREIARKIYVNPNCALQPEEVRFLYLDAPFICASLEKKRSGYDSKEFDQLNVFRRATGNPLLDGSDMRRSWEDTDLVLSHIRETRGEKDYDELLLREMLPNVIREQMRGAYDAYKTIAEGYNVGFEEEVTRRYLAKKAFSKSFNNIYKGDIAQVRAETGNPLEVLDEKTFQTYLEKKLETWQKDGTFDFMVSQAMRHGNGFLLTAFPQGDRLCSNALYSAGGTISHDRLGGFYDVSDINHNYDAQEDLKRLMSDRQYNEERYRDGQLVNRAVEFSLISSAMIESDRLPDEGPRLGITGFSEAISYWLRLDQLGLMDEAHHAYTRDMLGGTVLSDALFADDIKSWNKVSTLRSYGTLGTMSFYAQEHFDEFRPSIR